MSATAAPGQLESGAAHGRPHGRLRPRDARRVDQDPLGPLHVWSLVIFVVLTIGLTALLTWLTVHAIQTGRAPRRSADLVGDPVSFILQTGLGFGQLAICVLGVLTMTTEYSTGVIRASLLAVPKRLPVLAAKCAVFAGLIFVIAEIVVFCSFFVGKILVHPVVDVTLSQPGVARAVIGAGLYLTVLGLFALAIGSLIRHSAGAIAAVIGLVLVRGSTAGPARQLRLGQACPRLVPHRGWRATSPVSSSSQTSC